MKAGYTQTVYTRKSQPYENFHLALWRDHCHNLSIHHPRSYLSIQRVKFLAYRAYAVKPHGKCGDVTNPFVPSHAIMQVDDKAGWGWKCIGPEQRFVNTIWYAIQGEEVVK